MLDLNQPPIHVIRTGEAAKGEPYLITGSTSNYAFLYNDRHTGASMMSLFGGPIRPLQVGTLSAIMPRIIITGQPAIRCSSRRSRLGRN